MNWLTHIVLSKQTIEFQLGNFLADPLKGKAWEGASQDLTDGMAMHRAIDKFTDQHAVVYQSKARLKQGRLRAVVMDILYDHFLALDWDKHVAISQADLLKRFYAEAVAACEHYPEKARIRVLQLISSNSLAGYTELSGVIRALNAIDSRLSERLLAKETALSYQLSIEDNYDALQQDFRAFFPDLIQTFHTHLPDDAAHFLHPQS